MMVCDFPSEVIKDTAACTMITLTSLALGKASCHIMKVLEDPDREGLCEEPSSGPSEVLNYLQPQLNLDYKTPVQNHITKAASDFLTIETCETINVYCLKP